MYVINKCRVDYKYKVSSLGPIISKTAISNTVFTQIINEKIKIKKFVNKEKSGLFDLLKYTIIIYNISDEKVEKVFFKDKIPNGTGFIKNSVTINGIKKRCISPDIGFYIGNLEVKEKIKVTFKVIILNSNNFYIKNNSSIEYDYICNIEEDLVRRCKESNTIKTKYENNLFKQVLFRNSIKLSTNIEFVIKVKCIPKILSVKLINCYIKDQCGVLILGKLNYLVLYKSNGYIYCTKYVSGFSICMVGPIGISYLENIDIKIDEEYMVSKLINRNTIFVNNLFLIYC